jgi:[protein-PII] uridylyltransferase
MVKKTKPLQLVDDDALRHELTAFYKSLASNETKLRATVLAHLKDLTKHAHDRAETQLKKDGKGTQCAINLAHFQDRLIQVLYDFTVTHVYRAKNPSAGERVAIVAVGGYGRGTLAPGSDIDLLFLLPYKQTAWSESVIEYLLYMLWDLGFKVGHATRSVDECIRLSLKDLTIRTAVLEARFLWGDEALFGELTSRYDSQVMAGTAREFIEAKLTERDERHQQTGASRYLVEPNVKDGKGGQRDLHTLFWIGKYLYRVQSPKDLIKARVFTANEYRRFKKCEDFQWAVRCHLHFMTGSAENRLTFDYQEELAKRLGYTQHGGLRHVERFMKHYFLIAKQVGDLTRIFCAVLEAQEVKKTPVMNRLLARFGRGAARPIEKSDDFVAEAGRINLADDQAYERDPANLIRLFHLADRHDLAIHPDALKLVTRALRLIDKKLCNDPEANRLFLEILTSPNNPEVTLRKMNEAGVLGRFVRDFGRIVALMQFNMYHHFTVDEHLLRAIGMLAEIERGERGEEHPLSHELIKQVDNRRALYAATFLHDIAKGRPEDHSVAGARIARRLGPRLGLTSAETETCAWLVENHLVMSDFAQKRDLNDFKTIQDFAAIIQSPERLKLLLILTVVDIKAVGPGVWNGWKGQLLRTLYAETEPLLSGGHVTISREERVAAAKREFTAAVDAPDDLRLDSFLERHYPSYWLNVANERKLEHAGLLAEAEKVDKLLVHRFKTDQFTAISEVTICTPDHPRLLATIAGACAAVGANIVDAQIFTTTDGIALDTIFVQRAFDADYDEQRRGDTIADYVKKALRREISLSELIKRHAKPSARIKAFKIEPQVIIDNERSNMFTVIEVNGLDRPGFLYDLTNVLFTQNIKISSAHIATYGERAVDVFYVTDLTGQKISTDPRKAQLKQALLDVIAPSKPAKAKPTERRKAKREPVA